MIYLAVLLGLWFAPFPTLVGLALWGAFALLCRASDRVYDRKSR